MKTIEQIIKDMRDAATNSYAAKIAKELEDRVADAVTVRQAAVCLRDDDKAILDWADELEKALNRMKKTVGHLRNDRMTSLAEVRRVANSIEL